tara:strand:+ start:88 stop:732 length:645 start_codon:yes stop_codon:yes gene_type:complete
MSSHFFLDSYKHAIQTSLNLEYKFFRFKEYDSIETTPMSIVMRHDIDHNLELALTMAKIEASLGISSTFFVRTRAVKYNLLSMPSLNIVEQINNMGHEIGLHYEHFGKEANLNKDILLHVKILEETLGKRVVSISPHEPCRNKSFVFSVSELVGTGILHQAYEDKFFKDMKYISDSSAHWREGPMINFIEKKVKRLYILTHPFWWYNTSPSENY